MLKKISIAFLSVLLISFFACGQKSDQEAGTREESGTKANTATSPDGVAIHYTDYGSGDRALVFVHCWNCDESYWDHQVEEFKDDYRVVTVDLAGHGESGSNREDWTIQAYGKDVAAVVNQLDLNKIILIGHSLGGAVCIEAAINLPEKTVALIGIDTYQDLTQRATEQQADMFIAPFREDFSGQLRKFMKFMFPEGGDSALAAWVAADMAEADPEIALSSIRNLFLYDAEEALKDMRKPIRAINTDRFPTNLEGNKAITESYELKVMPGYGHFVHMENPDEFNRLLAETIHEFWPASDQ
jgi:pimeloyl-ACP methyl ester carboxylesterase